MTQPDEIEVGETAWYGVNKPEKVKVIGKPKLVNGRWLVLVERVDGECTEAMLTFVHVEKKRPSARRGRAQLKTIVEGYNEGPPSDEQISPELLEDRMKKMGLGR